MTKLFLLIVAVSLFGAKGVLIPFYHYPSFEDSETKKLIWLKKAYPHVHIIAIINPNNGHFHKEEYLFAKMIDELHENNITTIGYVHTSYGNRQIEKVREDIENWARFYKKWGILGIFLDEVNCSNPSYYSKLSDYIRRHFYLVVANPGVVCGSDFFDANISDIVVIHENSHSDFTPVSTHTDTAVLLHSTAKFDDALIQKTDYIYITEQNGSNPWGKLSNHLERLLGLIERGFHQNLNKKPVQLQTQSHE